MHFAPFDFFTKLAKMCICHQKYLFQYTCYWNRNSSVRLRRSNSTSWYIDTDFSSSLSKLIIHYIKILHFSPFNFFINLKEKWAYAFKYLFQYTCYWNKNSSLRSKRSSSTSWYIDIDFSLSLSKLIVRYNKLLHFFPFYFSQISNKNGYMPSNTFSNTHDTEIKTVLLGQGDQTRQVGI